MPYRPNAGRKPGSKNYPKAQKALLQATFPKIEVLTKAERASAVPAMRRALDEAMALKDTAKRAGNMGDYKYWDRRVIDIAKELAPYQQPKLSAVMMAAPQPKIIDFKFKIFEHDRRERLKQIEAQSNNNKIINAEPAPVKEAAPVEDKPAEQQATPASPTNEVAPPAPAPQSEPNAYPVGSGQPLFGPYGHPALMPWRLRGRWN